MNDDEAVCPQCQKEVVFVREAAFKRCPECGFQYQLNPPRLPSAAPERNVFAEFAGLVLKVVLIMAGLVVVGIAVLFAGCAVILSHH